MKILQKAGISGSSHPSTVSLSAPTVLATGMSSRGQSTNVGRGSTMSGIDRNFESPAVQPLLRTMGSRGGQSVGNQVRRVTATENMRRQSVSIGSTRPQAQSGTRTINQAGTSGLRTVSGTVGEAAGLRSAGAAGSGASGLQFTSGVSRATTRLQPAGGAGRETTRLRTTAVTEEKTGIHAQGLRTEVSGEATGSEAITLNEETLRAIQNVGGIVNANGEITLNEEAMKVLQNIRGSSSGQRTTSPFTSSTVLQTGYTATGVTGGTAGFTAGHITTGQSGLRRGTTEFGTRRTSGTRGTGGTSVLRTETAALGTSRNVIETGTTRGTSGLGATRGAPRTRLTGGSTVPGTGYTATGGTGGTAGFTAETTGHITTGQLGLGRGTTEFGTRRTSGTRGTGGTSVLRTETAALGASRNTIETGTTRGTSGLGATRGAPRTRLAGGSTIPETGYTATGGTAGFTAETAGQSGLRRGTTEFGTSRTPGTRGTGEISGFRTQTEALGASRNAIEAGTTSGTSGLGAARGAPRTRQAGGSTALGAGYTTGGTGEFTAVHITTGQSGLRRGTTEFGTSRTSGTRGTSELRTATAGHGPVRTGGTTITAGAAGMRTGTTGFGITGTQGTARSPIIGETSGPRIRTAGDTGGPRKAAAGLGTITGSPGTQATGTAGFTAGTVKFGAITGTSRYGVIGAASALRAGAAGSEATRRTAGFGSVENTGALTLNAETLKAIQNVGGIVNEKGEITLNEEAMKILHKTRSAQTSLASFTTSTTPKRNAASQITGPVRSGMTMGATEKLAKPESVATKPLTRTTGSLHRQPTRDYIRRGSAGEQTRRQSTLLSNTQFASDQLSISGAGTRRRVEGAMGLRSSGGTGTITLNAEALKKIQNAGGIVNEKGEITLNDEVMQILQKTGDTSFGQRSVVSQGTRTALNRNVALHTVDANRGRTPVLFRVPDTLESSAKKPLLTSTLQRQPIRDPTARISANEEARRQSVMLSRKDSHILPSPETVGAAVTGLATTGETGAITLNAETIKAIQGVGGIVDENGKITLNEEALRILQKTDATGSVSFSTSILSKDAASEGRTRDQGRKPVRTNVDIPRKLTSTIPKPFLRTSGMAQEHAARLSSDSRTRIPSGNIGASVPVFPDIRTNVIRVPSYSETQDPLRANTVVFNGKEIDISGLKAGQILDENLQPIISDPSSLRIPNEALLRTSPVGTIPITGSASPQRSSGLFGGTSPQAPQRPSSAVTREGSQSYQRPAQAGSRSRTDFSAAHTRSSRLPGAIIPQRSPLELSTAVRSSGLSPAVPMRPGSMTTSTSGTSAGLRRGAILHSQFSAGSPRAPSAVPAPGSAPLNIQSLGISSPAVGSRIPTMRLSSTEEGSRRSDSLTNQISSATGTRTPGSGTSDTIFDSTRIPESPDFRASEGTELRRTGTGVSRAPQRDRLRPAALIQNSPVTGLRSEIAPGQRSSISGIRSGSSQRQEPRTRLRSSQPRVSSSDIPNVLGGSADSLTSGTVVFNGKEININGLRAGQVFDENLQPIFEGASGARTANAALPQTSSTGTSRSDLSQSGGITDFRQTGTRDQLGTSTLLHRSSGIQRLNQGGTITTYDSADTMNLGPNARRVSQSKITQEIAQDRIETPVIQEKQDSLAIFQDKLDLQQQQIVQDSVQLKVPSESPSVKLPPVQLSQKALEPPKSKQTQLRVEDVIEQSSEFRPYDITSAQVQEKVPAFMKVTQVSQTNIDIPTAQQRLIESDFLPKKSFLAPFNYGIPQIQYLKTGGRQTPVTQEQQTLEQIFV